MDADVPQCAGLGGLTVELGLQDKVVLITGASGGIGAGMAKAFAREGATVAVHYHTREAGAHATLNAIMAAGGSGKIFRADLRIEAEIDALVDAVVAQCGRIDCLVNNAGVVLKAYAEDTDAAHWDDTLSVNLRAPHLLSRGWRHWPRCRRWSGRRRGCGSTVSLPVWSRLSAHRRCWRLPGRIGCPIFRSSAMVPWRTLPR